jgi:signal transduction histidine kinase
MAEQSTLEELTRERQEHFMSSACRLAVTGGVVTLIPTLVIWFLYPELIQVLVYGSLALLTGLSGMMYPVLRRSGRNTLGKYLLVLSAFSTVFWCPILVPDLIVVVSAAYTIIVVIGSLVLGARVGRWMVGLSLLGFAIDVILVYIVRISWSASLDETAAAILSVSLGTCMMFFAATMTHQNVKEQEMYFGQSTLANLEIARRMEIEHEQREHLEAANQELEAFAYSVSHDLRAPLRAIDGFSRILLKEHAPGLAPDTQRYLSLVRESAQQMNELIDGLLAFSRLGWQALEKEDITPTAMVHSVLQDLAPETASRQVQVDVGSLPPCQADPMLLRQVFANLLSNAIKFTRERQVAHIEVGCRDIEHRPVYFVRDNGVGFDMRYADKLFRVFQRLHSTDSYEGTGIGLAIVERIIRRHGGQIWAESEPGQGTAFYFTL